MRALRSLALLLAAALGLACGDTLVDHRNTEVRDDGSGATCQAGTAACGATGQECVPDSPAQCGRTCQDCTVDFTPPSAHAVAACVHLPQDDGFGTCGYTCVDGYLPCPSGCCEAAVLAAGDAHTCAIAQGGALYCWGANAAGQVTGNSTSAAEPSPVQVFASGATAVAAGRAHTCAVVSGAVRCWGENGDAQAPDDANVTGAVELAAGQSHSCARTNAGAVRCWGLATRTGGGTPIASGADALTAGWDHTCALVDGAVRCWGANASAQLGDGSTTATSAIVETIPSGIAALAAGRNHACVALASPVEVGGVSDAVKCWGAAPGLPFRLALPQLTPAVPMRSDGDQSTIRSPVTRLSAGRSHTCVQRSALEGVTCFGPEEALGQLGGLAGDPGGSSDVGGTVGARGFAAGGDHGCAIFADGSVHCWGSNASGQLGDGTTVTPGVGSLVAVTGR